MSDDFDVDEAMVLADTFAPSAEDTHLIDRATWVFRKAYRENFNALTADESDHYEATRCGVEAVLLFIGTFK